MITAPQSLSNQSPPAASAKREYSRTRPETFGDFHLKFGCRESGDEIECAKSRDFGPFSRFSWSLAERANWWLGREDLNFDMANSKSDAVACPREAAEPLSVEIYK